MTYAVNDVKKDPESGWVALKTGMSDPAKSWLVVNIGDGKTHYVPDEDVASWSDMTVAEVPEDPPNA